MCKIKENNLLELMYVYLTFRRKVIRKKLNFFKIKNQKKPEFFLNHPEMGIYSKH